MVAVGESVGDIGETIGEIVGESVGDVGEAMGESIVGAKDVVGFGVELGICDGVGLGAVEI